MSENTSTTKTLRLSVTEPYRPYDYVYDENHILAGPRDHAKATMKAQMNIKRVRCVPYFGNMFSELRHHPRFESKIETVDPLPAFFSREWRDYQTVARETMVRCRRSYRDAAKCFEAGHQLAANRYKYFKGPVTKNICHAMPPSNLLAIIKFDPTYRGEDNVQLPAYSYEAQFSEHKIHPSMLMDIKTRNVSTQTVYRDSEAQTTPYSPPYVVEPGTQPEILGLANLTSKKGLPAGLHELYMIERTRANRKLELSLPEDMPKEIKFKVQLAILEANNICHWLMREQELERMQKDGLDALIQLIKTNEERLAKCSEKRFDLIWKRMMDEKNVHMRKLTKIKNEFSRSLRKLIVKRKKKLEIRLKRRQIESDFADFGSQAFAPLTRVGQFLDVSAQKYEVRSRYAYTYEGLYELENSADRCLLDVCVHKPERCIYTKTGYLKNKYRYEKLLEDMTEIIDKRRNGDGAVVSGSLHLMEEIEKKTARAVTPSVDVVQFEGEENVELAVSFLQTLLRGRATQNLMFEGMGRMSELIEELRAENAIDEDSKIAQEAERRAMISLIEERQETDHKNGLADSELNQLDSESLSDLMDFLSKELLKLQEEQRLHAMSMLIERQRRLREAEEAGERQVEERRRREEEDIFKQTIKVHQVTIDSYLEDVLMTAVDHHTEREARCEIQTLARNIDYIVHELEKRRTDVESDAIVAELVNSFLIPEVQKEMSRQRVRDHQRKYLKAAHDEIFSAFKKEFPSETNKDRDIDI